MPPALLRIDSFMLFVLLFFFWCAVYLFGLVSALRWVIRVQESELFRDEDVSPPRGA